MNYLVRTMWSNEEGQDIAEYSVMLAVILVIVVGTVRLIGSNPNNVFSWGGSPMQEAGIASQNSAVQTSRNGGSRSRYAAGIHYCPTAAFSSLLATFTPLSPFTYL